MTRKKYMHAKQRLPESLTHYLEFIPRVLPSALIVASEEVKDAEQHPDLSRLSLVELTDLWSAANRQSLRIAQKFGNGKYFKEMQGEIFWDLSTGKRY